MTRVKLKTTAAIQASSEADISPINSDTTANSNPITAQTEASWRRILF